MLVGKMQGKTDIEWKHSKQGISFYFFCIYSFFFYICNRIPITMSCCLESIYWSVFAYPYSRTTIFLAKRINRIDANAWYIHLMYISA